MNERIKELAKVAVQYTNDTVAHLERVHNRDFTFEEIDEVYDTKFAELIVRECADIAIEQKKWVEDQEVFNPQDEPWNRARIQQSQRIVDKIREHFGVEE